jgi:hypothetical protein
MLKTLEIAAVGAPGSASGSAEFGLYLPAKLEAVEVDYAATAPATTDLTISCEGRTILTLSNSASDRVVYPRVPVQDMTGADIAGPFVLPTLRGRVTVTLAQSNALSPAATVRLHVV